MPIGSSCAAPTRSWPITPAASGADQTIYDPWHYLPVLATQARRPAQRRAVPGLGAAAGPDPAAGASWAAGDEADRRFVRVLAAVLIDGMDAVEDAVRRGAGRPAPPATT